MRAAIRIRVATAAGLLLAIHLPRTAAAQSVTVIRGSEVVVVGPERFARDAQREVAPAVSRTVEDSSPPAGADSAPAVVVVVVDLRDHPETAWAYVNPWPGYGIRGHWGEEGSEAVAGPGRYRRVSDLRIHGSPPGVHRGLVVRAR